MPTGASPWAPPPHGSGDDGSGREWPSADRGALGVPFGSVAAVPEGVAPVQQPPADPMRREYRARTPVARTTRVDLHVRLTLAESLRQGTTIAGPRSPGQCRRRGPGAARRGWRRRRRAHRRRGAARPASVAGRTDSAPRHPPNGSGRSHVLAIATWRSSREAVSTACITSSTWYARSPLARWGRPWRMASAMSSSPRPRLLRV